MTRKKAITVLKAFMENPLFSDEHKQAFNIAIHDIKQRHDWDINNLILINKDNYEPVEQELCEDWYDIPSDEMTLEQARQAVRDLRKMWAEHLWQEPCEDAISREDALQALCRAVHKNDDTIPCSNQRVSCLWNKTKVQDYAEEILKLPPVTPQPKIGRWIEVAKYSDGKHKIKCSECGSHIFDRGHANSCVVKEKYKYCPNCGAKMEVSR